MLEDRELAQDEEIKGLEAQVAYLMAENTSLREKSEDQNKMMNKF